ncbi:DUF4381 family protein [Candidatus Dependentiae bacterium]|nr:DUF4381 family protein [Candidatus Dependentiae bacterium]
MHVELDDVYDVWVTSFWQTFAGKISIVAGIIVTALVCYGLFKLIKQYRKQSIKDRALKGLRALRQRVEKNNQDPKKVYQGLTTLIKMYAQGRFGLVPGLSDYELMTALSTKQGGKDEESLRRIMEQAQVIKFGLAAAQRTQMKEDIDTVINFITMTEKETQKRSSLEI